MELIFKHHKLQQKKYMNNDILHGELLLLIDSCLFKYTCTMVSR